MVSQTVAQCLRWLISMQSLFYTLLTAAGISALVDIRQGKSIRYTITGAIICGMVAVAILFMFDFFDLPDSLGAFVGALVGFAGADQLRNMAMLIIERRFKLKEEKPNSNE